MKNISGLFLCGIAVFICNTCLAQLQEVLMLTVSHGENSDQTAVRFLNDATDSFDSQWDAYKWDNSGNTPNLSTVSDEKYAINSLNNQFEEKTLALYFEGAFPGTYTLNAEELGAFDSTWIITLIDKHLNIEQDLRAAPDYVFDGQPSDAPNRFLLQFHVTQIARHETVTAISPPNTITDEEVVIYTYQDNIIIQTHGASAVVFITDLYGHEITNTTIASDATSPWTFAPGKQGIYIVNLTKGTKHYYKKLYVVG